MEDGQRADSRLTVSPYALSERAADGSMWLLNVLHGSLLRLSTEEWGSLGDSGASAERDELLTRLAEAHVLNAAGEDDRHSYRSVVSAGDLDTTSRLGYVLDGMDATDVAVSPGYCRDVLGLSDDEPGATMVHAWYFTAAGRDRVADLMSVLGRLPSGAEGRYLALSTNGLHALDERQLANVEQAGPECRTSVVTFVLSMEAAEEAGGVEAYSRGIFEQQGAFYTLGVLPLFVFRCTRDSLKFMTETLYPALCFAGVYPYNIYLTYSRPRRDPLDAACELYGWDWELYASESGALGASPIHQAFEPLGRGLADKLRALLRDGKEPPNSLHCPFARRSYVFGRNGTVGPCPVAVGRTSPTPSPFALGNLRSLELRTDRVTRWELRGPNTIKPCGSCRVAPICGSGCPLQAFEDLDDLYGAPCPPAPLALTVEVELAATRRASRAGMASDRRIE